MNEKIVRSHKKSKRGSIISVNKQRSRAMGKVSKMPTIFIGKLTPKYNIPSNLQNLLQKYIENNNIDSHNNNHNNNQRRKKKDPKRKTIVNGFTAFRTYFSKFGKSYKDQEKLSKELAIFWNKEPSTQDVWHGYSEEYKASDTNLSFVHWFDTYKSNIVAPPTENQQPIIQSAKISHLIVEDLYQN